MNVATWRIGRLALVVACLGLLALSTTQRAGAADNNPSSNGTAQVLWCQSMGGTATVEETRTNADGLTMTIVTCSGGLGGSWTCINTLADADCVGGRVSFPDWDDMEEMEETPPQAQADPDDDEKQDTNKSKGKKHKKGKKGGKGRKK
jgi:hypothetical protein